MLISGTIKEMFNWTTYEAGPIALEWGLEKNE